MRDVITFRGGSTLELKRARADCVEDYLAFCAKQGEAPEKSYSGQFLIRTGPALHRALAIAARREGMSLSKWVRQALERALN